MKMLLYFYKALECIYETKEEVNILLVKIKKVVINAP